MRSLQQLADDNELISQQSRPGLTLTVLMSALEKKAGVRIGSIKTRSQSCQSTGKWRPQTQHFTALTVNASLVSGAQKRLHSRSGSAHIQAGIVGSSEVIPIRDGNLALSTWQNIFLCDFDGTRTRRTVIVTIQGE
jgi:hypothetical protein